MHILVTAMVISLVMVGCGVISRNPAAGMDRRRMDIFIHSTDHPYVPANPVINQEIRPTVMIDGNQCPSNITNQTKEKNKTSSVITI
ncbi:hypothetical protein F4861DRAFT_497868, partial [Xylaria intraflava]